MIAFLCAYTLVLGGLSALPQFAIYRNRLASAWIFLGVIPLIWMLMAIFKMIEIDNSFAEVPIKTSIIEQGLSSLFLSLSIFQLVGVVNQTFADKYSIREGKNLAQSFAQQQEDKKKAAQKPAAGSKIRRQTKAQDPEDQELLDKLDGER